MASLRTFSAPRPGLGATITIAIVLSFAAAGCGGSSATTKSSSTAAFVAAAPNSSTTDVPSATSTAEQPTLPSTTVARAVRKPRIRHQPRTRPTPTPRAELTSFESTLGTAFGSFHRYVYKPYKSGGFVGNAVTKAGAAETATLQEVLEAKQEAVGGTAVRTLFAPLAALAVTLNQLSTKLERGQLDNIDMQVANSQIASIEQAATAAGVRIRERASASAPTAAPAGGDTD